MVRVKICGITNAADARYAVQEGADAIGFVFAKSPRRVEAAAVKKILGGVGPLVAAIGVFVDESEEKMLRIADHCGLSGIQLHGDESARTVRRLQKQGFRVIKAIRAVRRMDAKRMAGTEADALLFDTAHAGQFGGTGIAFDWSYLKKLDIRIPWIVSGGLDPVNVKKLLSTFRPYGVDVSSGVERVPGKKSEKLVREFIRNAKFTR